MGSDTYSVMVTSPTSHLMPFMDIGEEVIEIETFVPFVCENFVNEDIDIPDGLWHVRAERKGAVLDQWAFVKNSAQSVVKVSHPFTLSAIKGSFEVKVDMPQPFHPWDPPKIKDHFYKMIKDVKVPKIGFWEFSLKDCNNRNVYFAKKFKFGSK